MNNEEKIKEYEQQLRLQQEDLSESDIAFLVDVYRLHLKANSSKDAERYSEFAQSCINENICHEDISLAIKNIETFRKAPNVKSTSDEKTIQLSDLIDYATNNKPDSAKGVD